MDGNNSLHQDLIAVDAEGVEVTPVTVNVFGFDGKKGLKGVVSKEHERRDAQKFQGMSSLKKALKGKTSHHFPPAAAPRQPPPPRDADDLRQKRLARFG